MEEVLTIVQKYFELVIEWAVILCDVIGVVMIVLTAIRGVIAWIRKDPHAKLIAAEGIAIALTFKMGGEVLRTAIVRDWQELMILGAIVLLRAIMAFIIHFEIRNERQTLGDDSIPEPNEQTDGQSAKQPGQAPDVLPAKQKRKLPIIKL